MKRANLLCLKSNTLINFCQYFRDTFYSEVQHKKITQEGDFFDKHLSRNLF